MSSPGPTVVRVDLAARGYDVLVGRGLLGSLPTLAAAALGRPIRAACLVLDANARQHADALRATLASGGINAVCVEIHASEKAKSLDTLRDILTAMGAARLEREDPVIAVGGGITGDLAGFAAATYRRGVPVVQCPTTLLAMVDASVGGKTGVNLDAAGSLQKNMVGAFHQPSLVVADIDALTTLPEREFRAGLAECIKHGLIDNRPADTAPPHLEWIDSSLDNILRRDPDTLLELIERSVAFKASVVRDDERETAGLNGGRALLNLGHTFAHAIETLHHLSPTHDPADAPLLHGEAVGLGLIAAASTAVATGDAPAALTDTITSLLRRCALPTAIAGLPEGGTLLALMGADKKASGGRLRLIIPTGFLGARIASDVDPAAINAGWDAIRLA